MYLLENTGELFCLINWPLVLFVFVLFSQLDFIYSFHFVGDFVKANGLQEGDFIVIYSDVKCGKFVRNFLLLFSFLKLFI
jgi:hypothetical protein